MKIRVFCLIFIIFSFSLFCSAEESYTETVGNAERYSLVNDFLFDLDDPSKKEVNWSEILFDARVSSELKANYKYRFGYSPYEQIDNVFNHHQEHIYGNGSRVSLEEDFVRKMDFGYYMGKRLVEYHFDRIIKTNPNTRRVYEMKEKLSNVNVELKKGYKFSSRYYFSGNHLDLKLTTPVDFIQVISLRMNPESFMPTSVNDIVLSSYYSFTKRSNVAVTYQLAQERMTTTFSQGLINGMGLSLTLDNKSLDIFQGSNFDRVMLGMNWNY